MTKHIDTIAVHAGREDFQELGIHSAPLDFSSTYPVKDLESGRDSIDALAAGGATADSPIYARLHNPTVHRYECAFAKLENAEQILVENDCVLDHLNHYAYGVMGLDPQKGSPITRANS